MWYVLLHPPFFNFQLLWTFSDIVVNRCKSKVTLQTLYSRMNQLFILKYGIS